jgi:hypothetical protein
MKENEKMKTSIVLMILSLMGANALAQNSQAIQPEAVSYNKSYRPVGRPGAGGDSGGGGSASSFKFRTADGVSSAQFSQYEGLLAPIIDHQEKYWYADVFPVGFVIGRRVRPKTDYSKDVRFIIKLNQLANPSQDGIVAVGTFSFPKKFGKCEATDLAFIAKASSDNQELDVWWQPGRNFRTLDKDTKPNAKFSLLDEKLEAKFFGAVPLRARCGMIGFESSTWEFSRTQNRTNLPAIEIRYTDKTRMQWSERLFGVYANLSGNSEAEKTCNELPGEMHLPTKEDYERLITEMGSVDDMFGFRMTDEGRARFNSIFKNRYPDVEYSLYGQGLWTSSYFQMDTAGEKAYTLSTIYGKIGSKYITFRKYFGAEAKEEAELSFVICVKK